MARIDPIPREEMTAEQVRVSEAIAAARSADAARGPFAIWLRTPALAEIAGELGAYLRTRTSLPRRLLELAVLTVARAWTAQYEWFAHAKFVEAAGLDPALVEAIRTGRPPAFGSDEEAIVHEVATELIDSRRLGEDTYRRAVSLLGEQAVIDLVTVVGYYVMVALVLVALEVETPDGSTPLPPLNG